LKGRSPETTKREKNARKKDRDLEGENLRWVCIVVGKIRAGKSHYAPNFLEGSLRPGGRKKTIKESEAWKRGAKNEISQGGTKQVPEKKTEIWRSGHSGTLNTESDWIRRKGTVHGTTS